MPRLSKNFIVYKLIRNSWKLSAQPKIEKQTTLKAMGAISYPLSMQCLLAEVEIGIKGSGEIEFFVCCDSLNINKQFLVVEF